MSFFDWALKFKKGEEKNTIDFTKSEYANFMKKWRETRMPLKVINIFDIDGTICENIFPNLNREVNIKQLKAKILQTPLFPDFIEYYKHITQDISVKTYFITGRRFKDFGAATFYQLQPFELKDQQIIFFPDNFNHSKIRHDVFKIFNILKIAAAVSAVTDPGIINIFDDLCQYYPKLLSIAGKLGFSNINVHIIKDPEQYWKLKINQVKNND